MKVAFSLGALTLVILTLPLPASAADDDLYFSELPVVATVSRLPQRLEKAPTSVTVIDRTIIRATGARDLNDVFRLVPGFQTYPHNTESPRVSYHGLNDEEYSPRVQVMVDGRSLYSPLFRNGVNWALIPVAIDDIERIEVVRGSNNVSYGSNAFLGVINIITVNPVLTQGVSVAVNHGTQDVRDQRLRVGGQLGESGHFRFTYEQKDDDGLTDQFDWRDYRHTRLFDMRADFQLSTVDELQFNLGRAEASSLFGRLQKNGSVILPVGKLDDPLRDYDQSSTYLQAQWRRFLGPDSELKIHYAFAEDKATDGHLETKSGTFKINGVNTGVFQWVDAYGGLSRTHELEAEHVFSPFGHARLAWGGSWRYDTLSAPDHLYGQGTVNRSVERFFGNLEWQPVDWFTGNVGLAFEHDSLGGTHESPRLSGNFHLDPQNTLRFSWGKAYRTGSIIDYRGDRRYLPYQTLSGAPIDLGSVYRRRLLGDPDMPAEKLETYEIGYLGDWKELRMSLDVRAFIERVPNRLFSPLERVLPDGYCNALDLVLAPTCTGIKADYTTPIQNVKTQGIEYQWRWQPFDGTRLILNQAFLHIDAEFLPGLAYNESRDLLTKRSAPSHTTSMLWMQKLPLGLDFSLAGYWLGASRWTANTEVPSYHRIDARLAYPFKVAGQSGEIAYAVQSLNGAHAEYKGAKDPGITDALLAARIVERRQWVSLRLDF